MDKYNSQIEALINKLAENKEYKLSWGLASPATCTKKKGIVSVVKEEKINALGREITNSKTILQFEFPDSDIAELVYEKVNSMK